MTLLQPIDQHRTLITTPACVASCIDTGGPGRAAVFVHGLGTSSYLCGRHRAGSGPWPAVRSGGSATARSTPAAQDQDFSLTRVAGFVQACCEALELGAVHLLPTTQGEPSRRSSPPSCRPCSHTHTHQLRGTRQRTSEKIPADHVAGTVRTARGLAPRLMADPDRARRRVYRSGYEDVATLPVDLARAWLTPLVGTAEAARQLQRFILSMRAHDLLAAEPGLRRLQAPTLIVWGTADRFFHRKWAYWLASVIPGVTDVLELAEAKLFFPDERPHELAVALRELWESA